MTRMLLGVSRICLVIALSGAPAWGQATGQISGTARDESGAVLPGVTVTATQTDTGIARTTVTNASGAYALPNLPLGPYRVEAVLQGFGMFARGVVLEVNSSVTIDPLLQLAQVAETVEVQASAPLVETRSATVGAVMQSEQIAELPLNGRNVNDLITLAGGAVSAGEARSEDFVGASSPMIGVAGSAGYGVGYTLDGANHTTFVTGSAMVMPFPDATQEFKVETSGVTAERERSAAVSVVTKSGTNQLRGTLFEFFRNDLFNATNFFAAVDPQTGEKEQSTLKRNQFGGVIGGPIVRNRVFFLGGYQGTLRRQDPQSIRAFVPTAAVLAGDWTQVTSPACNNGRQITLRAPFVNNRINPALYSRAALGVVSWKGPTLPFPTTDDPCGEITYGDMSADQEGLYVGKVDYQQSNAHALFGRVLVQRYNLSNPEEFNTHLLQNTGYRNTNQGSYTLGSTYVINASTVHSFRFAYNKTAVHFDNVGPGVLPTWCDLGVNLYCAPEVTRIQNMTVTGAFNVHSSQLTGHRYAGDSFSINDDLTLVRGAHQLAFGGSIMRGTDDSAFIFASPHQFRFTGGQTGLGMADFLLGRPTTFLTGITNPLFQQETDFSLYANDVWRATPVLTVNAGVRWDPYLPPYTDAIYNFDLDRFRQGITSSVFVNAPAGIYYRGDPGFPENGVNPRWWQFAPRAGLAWDVSRDGTMSVRTSYARGYLQIPGNYRQGYAGSSPWGARLTIVNPSGGLDDPFAGIQGANIFPYELDQHAPFPPAGLFFTQPYDLKQPTTQSWSVAVQRELGWRTAVSASYLGSNIRHAWMNKALDPAIVFPGVADANGLCQAEGYTLRTTPGATCSTSQNTSARRKLTLERPEDGNKIGFLAEADDTGTQDYHGLLLSLDRRSVDGVSVNANYTWSRCEDTYQTLYSAMGAHPGDTYADPNDPDLDRGSCTTDRPHVLNLTVVAETPQFANPTLRMVGSGWRVSGIYRASSGQPLTIYAGSDRALNGSQVSNTTVLQRADQVLPDPYEDTSGRPGTRFLNPAAFALPALGTLGNSGRNSIRGPRLVSFDLAVSRVFPVFEDQRLEFRVEAFNVTNSFRPANPSTDVGAPNTFGLIRDALDPRILQFALKYVF